MLGWAQARGERRTAGRQARQEEMRLKASQYEAMQYEARRRRRKLEAMQGELRRCLFQPRLASPRLACAVASPPSPYLHTTESGLFTRPQLCSIAMPTAER